MTDTLTDRLRLLVTAPGTAALVQTFYDESGPFAGSLFDTLGHGSPGHNPANQLVSDDLLAVTLLDVGFMPRAVRTLLEQGQPDGRLGRLLAAVPSNVTLWEATREHLDAASALWLAIKEQTRAGVLSGVGPTKRSKLLARKRPHLVPIVDSVIRAALAPHLDRKTWEPLREALGDADLRNQIESLRPGEGAAQVSLLRLLDTVIWMWCSNGREAKGARAGLSHPLGW